MTTTNTRPRGDLSGFATGATHHEDEQPEADRCQAIGRHVHQHRRHRTSLALGHAGLGRPGSDNTDQHEPSMGDSGVGQQTLHIGLRETHDGAHTHRGHSHDGEHDLPVPSHRAQTDIQDAHQTDEGDEFGRDSHPAANRRRSASVDIGGPGGERNRAYLEQQPDGHQDHARDDEFRRADLSDARCS